MSQNCRREMIYVFYKLEFDLELTRTENFEIQNSKFKFGAFRIRKKNT